MLRYICIITLSTIFGIKADSNIKKDLTHDIYRNKRFLRNNYDVWLDNYNGRRNEYNDENNFYDIIDSGVDEKSPRRLFEWFTKFFKTTTPIPQTTVSTTEFNYERDLKERIFLNELQRNLTDVSLKVFEMRKYVSNVLAQREAYSIIKGGKPQVHLLKNQKHYKTIHKRDTSETEPQSIESTDLKSSNNSLKTAENSTNSSANVNVTESPCDKINASGRRSFTPSHVKEKLLLYLDEAFQEINNKIVSLKNIKQAFADNNTFRIGYIMANIDSLEINMQNLKRNMDNNKETWEDTNILELFDTLKISNQALSGLIESLKIYIENSTVYGQ